MISFICLVLCAAMALVNAPAALQGHVINIVAFGMCFFTSGMHFDILLNKLWQ